jgi:hypothetical protein
VKKPVVLVVVLVLVLVLITAASAVAQEERCPGMPDYPCRLDPESGLYQPLYTVACWAFYDPATACTVDENGLIEKPDGTKVPYTEAADFIAGIDGIYQFVDGEFVLVEAYPPAPPIGPDAKPPE